MDAVATAVFSGGPEAVSRLAGTISESSLAVRGLLEGGRATYDAVAQ